MKKLLILFSIFVFLLVLDEVAYNKHCKSDTEGYKKAKVGEKVEFPKKALTSRESQKLNSGFF